MAPAQMFNFTTVSIQPNGDFSLLNELHPFKKYGVVVQAFNQKGPGPMSTEFIVHTFEDGKNNF